MRCIFILTSLVLLPNVWSTGLSFGRYHREKVCQTGIVLENLTSPSLITCAASCDRNPACVALGRQGAWCTLYNGIDSCCQGSVQLWIGIFSFPLNNLNILQFNLIIYFFVFNFR